MTAADNRSIRARTDRPFRFYVDGTEFFPGAGSSLHYANRGVDSLTVKGVPGGLIDASSEVRVDYLGTTVFRGTADRISDTRGKGDSRSQTVVFSGPWGAMSRLVYRQVWHATPNTTYSTPRVILNQSTLGEAQSMTETVMEILMFAAARCGFSAPAGNVSVGDVCLPMDEVRDMTCASALVRELRFHPRVVVRFDYSNNVPAIVVAEPSGHDAGYLETVPETERMREYATHPIAAVDVYSEDLTVTVDGEAARTQARQVYPPNADIDGLDVLHAYIPLSPATSSTQWRTFLCEVEELPYFAQDKDFWLSRHPRLAGVTADQFTIIGSGERSGKRNFDRIAKASSEELSEAGVEYEVETFTIRAKISTAYDTDEDVVLSMTFLMTNGTNRRYTWQEGSSSVAAETLPDGLAEAIYRQRAGSLVNETMVIRLGDRLPTIGDLCDGLVLQDFDVDCQNATARLHFGQPEHISVEDMRDLLSGFRQRGYATNAPSRAKGTPSEEDAVDVGGIPPLSTSAWSPGHKSRTTVSSNAGTGKAIIDAEALDGKTASFRSMTYRDGAGAKKTAIVLATDPMPGGGGTGGGGDDEPYSPDDSGVKFTGTDGSESERGKEFTLEGGYDSNVKVVCEGNRLKIGVYYV